MHTPQNQSELVQQVVQHSPTKPELVQHHFNEISIKCK